MFVDFNNHQSDLLIFYPAADFGMTNQIMDIFLHLNNYRSSFFFFFFHTSVNFDNVHPKFSLITTLYGGGVMTKVAKWLKG